jgi:hypothetical protein
VNLSTILLGICIAIVIAVAIQHFRYLGIRRNSAQDRQSPFHSRNTFHVITFFDIRDGGKILPSTQAYLSAIGGLGNSRLIYAGHAAFVQDSQQLGEHQWDGVLLHEYACRSDFERVASRLEALAGQNFNDHHFHGMKRNRWFSLFIPILLLRLRVASLIKGRWRAPPLEHLPAFKQSNDFSVWNRRIARLRAMNKIDPHGLVVFSLIKRGNEKQRNVEASYTREMASRMAALDHGPIHVGRAVGVQGNARFDDAYVVHFPSAEYFADLLSSEFFQAIAGNRQLGDTTMVPTIPLTEQLLERLDNSACIQ